MIGHRVLGVDPGARRIGLALSDAGGTFASPHSVLDAGSGALDAIVGLVAREEVAEVVVGHPVSMDGGEGRASAEAKAFADHLRSRLGIPVTMLDERLTSVSAERAMRESGSTSRQMRGKVDQVAAAILLQSYLDARSG